MAQSGKVKVYYFRRYDINTDEWPRSRRRATIEAIARCRGEALEDTAREVDTSELDADGFVKRAS